MGPNQRSFLPPSTVPLPHFNSLSLSLSLFHPLRRHDDRPSTTPSLKLPVPSPGNYCQPKCAEPWVEVKFEDEKQGKVQVVASPLIRLTNKPNATIEDIGSPEKVIASLGPFVTGNTYDPDELLETSVEKLGDQTYYKYVLETPYALTGSHNLAKATAKGNTVVFPQIITGLQNFNKDNVDSIVTAVDKGGATHVDIACDPELVKLALSLTSRPVIKERS
ncbi:hypothetical protein RIF29_22211 [Crotalaria pallida]|uniref:Uncharacterized protein ycf23 n=1 Tax=Crotalaria pallida TaxID=3830 RepID=A0AAN9I7V8_CROPI